MSWAAIVISIGLQSCNHGGGAAATSQPPESLLALQILEPTSDLSLAPGARLVLTFRATDPRGLADAVFTADPDGDLSTPDGQHELATARADESGSERSISLVLPRDIAAGSYAVLGCIEDTENGRRVAKAQGRLVVAGEPLDDDGGGTDPAAIQLRILEPAQDLVVSRGGIVHLSFTALDADATGTLQLMADTDGDPSTSADQHVLVTLPTSPADAVESVAVDLAGLPLGTYRVLGVASAPGQADVVAAAEGRIEVANVAFAEADGGNDYEEGRAIAILPDGSIAVTGRFAGSPMFGEWPLQTGLDAAGDDDVFLCRYHPDGRLAWARRAGGPSRGDWGNSLAPLADGSVVLGGYFHGLASFDNGPLAAGVLSAGENDGFVARYDPSGGLLWVRRAGGVFNDQVNGVAAFTDGSCVATGSFAAQATFAGGGNTATLLVQGSLLSSDGFVARHLADGTLAWARRFGGPTGDDSGRSVAAAADGSCVVAGSFVGTATFGEGGNQVTLTAADGVDGFLARYAADGTLLWARRAGGAGDDFVRSVAALPDGAFVATGSFQGAATIGDPSSPVGLLATGAADAFVAKFAADGTLAWVRTAGGASADEGTSVAALGNGGCIVTGFFHALASFPNAPAPTNLTAAGLRDVFVARYDASGSLVWARSAGGASQDQGNGVACFPDGSCAITGTFLDAATFSPGSAPRSLFPVGWGDVFVVRYNADGAF